MDKKLEPIPAPVVNTDFEIDLFNQKAKVLTHEEYFSYERRKGITVNIFAFSVEITLFGMNEFITANKIDAVFLDIVFIDFGLTKLQLKLRWDEFVSLVNDNFDKYIVHTIFVSMQAESEKRLGWK